MPTKWGRMVEKEIVEFYGCNPPQGVLFAKDAEKILARQHARTVRMVKRLRTSQKFPPIMKNSWYQAACNDILAALAKEKGGKK